MEEQKETVCRVCLQTEESKCFSVFEISDGCSIKEKILSITNVEIHEGDGLPDKICPACLLELDTAITFKRKCEASNKILLGKAKEFVLNLSPLHTSEDLKNDTPVKIEYIEIDYKENIDDPETEYLDTGAVTEEYLEEEVITDPNVPVKKSKAIDLKLICDDCGGSFKSKCKLRVHWKKVHKPERLICPNCKRVFKSFKPFNLHIKEKGVSCTTASKVRVEGQGKSRVFHCKECSYKSIRIKDLTTHIAIHTGVRKFQCKDCHKRFTQLSSLHAHREITHKEFKITATCHLCGKLIQGRNNYYKHMTAHKQTSIQCKICNKVLKNKKYYRSHMLRHGDTKSYSCEVCGSSFYTYYELYNHRARVHSEIKYVQCDQCDYKMKTKAQMKIHRAKHNGTNVVCMFCGQFSENEEVLAIHQKRHLNKNVHCTQCEKTFYNKKSLGRHMSKHHRCTMLMQKRQKDDLPVTPTTIKQESPQPDNKGRVQVIITQSQTIILKNI